MTSTFVESLGTVCADPRPLMLRMRHQKSSQLTGVRSFQDSGPESVILLRLEHDALLTALEKLSPTEQETLRLVEWEGLSREQVAELFGVTRSAIDQRIGRAYQHLQATLGDAVLIGGAPRWEDR